MFTLDCTPHTKKQIIEPKVSLTTNYVPIANYKSIKPPHLI